MKKNIKSINNFSKNIINIKNGVVYTPSFIVKNMLDIISYKSNVILKKHVIDNSCGEGAFLVEIVKRYIRVAKKNKLDNKIIASHLEKFIHGIEIDYISYDNCINNLNALLLKFGINENVKWDIIRGDALRVDKFNNKMDYVVGNPPYIRIHDLDFDYRKYNFSSEGMTDLYLIFFELGINMLNELGKMIYITPNSFFTSNAAKKFRNYLMCNNLLKKIVNLGHFNPFKNITTYPAITFIDKIKKNNSISYFEYDKFLKKERFIAKLKPTNIYIKESFYFGEIKKLKKFNEIMSVDINPDILIKNGAATNLDSAFYNDNYEGKHINKAIKISKLKETKVFFPYDKNGNLISLNEIKTENPNIFKVLLKNELKLKKRNLQNQEWYEFARTQAIKDVWKEKMVINNIIKNLESIKIKIIEPGVIPYSGYYLLSEKYDFNFLKKILLDNEFIEYLKILGKDKNGEYYFFSPSDLLTFFSYKIKKINEGN